METLMVTTVDNPHDPFDEFDDWFAFDTMKGYNTLSLLGRIAITSNNLSDTDQILANNQAVEKIVELNVLGIYRKVSRDL